MKRLLLLLAVGAGLVGAPLARAADSDPCSTSATYWSGSAQGRMVPIWCVVLCDALTTNKDCTNFDMRTVGGIPDLVAFELHEVDSVTYGTASDCTAITVTVNTAPSTASMTTASENAYDLDPTITALAIGGTTKILLDTKSAPLDRYVLATSTLEACTTDTVDILMIGYEEKK